MEPLLSAESMREVDSLAIRSIGIPELVLMEHAGLAVVGALERRFHSLLPETSGVILAGPGNNGGDACAVARLLQERGCRQLFVVFLGNEAQLSDSAKIQFDILSKVGIPRTKELSEEVLRACDWVVDGVFGTGLKRPIEGKIKTEIDRLNAFADKKWIVSIDLPSGLCSDTGNALGVAVRASETVTLGFIKRGMVTGDAADYIGKLTLAPIQIPRNLPVATDCFLYTREDASRIPPRRLSGHKGEYGHVYLWAGPEEKEGASVLAALGALKSGAGLATVLGSASQLSSLRSRMPAEIMTQTFSGDFSKLPKKSVLVMGPGMGTSKESWEMLKKALSTIEMLVLDADALNLLSQNASAAQESCRSRHQKKWVTCLTPHPKEASRLLSMTTEQIQRDRYASIRQLTHLWESIVVLKGKGTLLSAPEGPVIVVTTGDAGLSKAGTGDLLSGVLSGMLAQNIPHIQAASLAAYLHGRASELLTQARGQNRSSLASEIADMLPSAIAEVSGETHERNA